MEYEVNMPEHYIDKWDWRDTLFYWVSIIVIVPIAFLLRLLFGDGGKND